MCKLLLLFFLAISASPSIQAATDTAFTVKSIPMETFRNPQKGYSFQYPENWIRKDDLQGVDIFIMAPPQETGQSQANLSVIAELIPKEVNLQTFYDGNIKELLDSNPKIKVLEKGQSMVAGQTAFWIRYLEDEQLEIIHYFFFSNGYGILITCGATKEAFNQYKTTFDKIVRSFTIESFS